MKLLTNDNISYELDSIPDEIDDLRFCVLDNSNPKNPDYFFMPLIFLESFNAPALVIRIGTHVLKMPVDWQILIGEAEVGDLEISSYLVEDEICSNNLGSVDINVQGGSMPYTYAWNNGATTQMITATANMNYCVTVTDGIGCSSTACYNYSANCNLIE